MSDDLLSRIKDLIPEIRGDLNARYGAAVSGYREAIRQSLTQNLEPLSKPEKAALADLKLTPRLKDWSVSISHCRTLGGWIARPRPGRLGFDIEIRERIEPRLISRIATPVEMKAAPDPAFLWCAKESYFKSIEIAQPVTFTDLKILSWRPEGRNLWRFTTEKHGPSHGWLLAAPDWLCAVCVSD